MTLLLHDNSDMWRMMASLPDCPWSPHCPMSAVSGPGPRLSPARAPSPDSQHPDTGARIRQDPEFWRIFPTKNGPRATNILRLTREGRGQSEARC